MNNAIGERGKQLSIGLSQKRTSPPLDITPEKTKAENIKLLTKTVDKPVNPLVRMA